MKRFSGLFIIAINLFYFVGAASSPQNKTVERVMTLPKSVEGALYNNHRLLSTLEDIRIAHQRVREAQTLYLPRVGVNLNGSRYLAEQDIVLPAEFGSTILRPSRGIEADNFYAARVSLRQRLYAGKRTRNTVLLAKASLEKARVRHEQIRSDVVYQAIKSFYDLLLYQKQLKVSQETLKDVSKEMVRIPKKKLRERLAVGAIREGTRQNQSEKRRLEKIAYLEYLNVLGLELYTKVGIDGKLEKVKTDLDLQKLLVWAQESRFDIRGTEFQTEIDRLAVSLIKAERNPVIAFGADYEFNDPTFPLESTQWNATLNISLPIYDGLASRARIRQRRHQANKNRIERASIQEYINLEVRQVYGELMYWESELGAREEELNQLKKMDQNLRKTNGPLNRAQAKEQLMKAYQAYWESVHGQLVALANLEKVVGRPLF